MRTAEGKPFWGEVSFYVKPTPRGDLSVCIIKDVSDRKAAEEALRRANEALESRVRERTAALHASEEKFFKAFAANPAALTLARVSDNRFVDVNETFLRLFGYTRDEVIGRTPAELGTWASLDERAAMVRELLTAGSLRNREVTFLTKARARLVGLLSCELLLIEGAEHVLAVFTDITERKRAEQFQAEQQRLLTAMVDQALDGLVVCDRTGRIMLMNQAARRLASRPIEGDALPATPQEWVQPFDDEGKPIAADDYSLARALRGEVIEGREIRLARQDGSAASLLVSAAPLRNDRQEIVGAVAAFFDITATKQAQAQLQVALQDKSTLLREVNHRFKNNLQILSNLLAMQSRFASDAARPALQASRDRVQSIATLEEQLLASAEPGRVGMQKYVTALVQSLNASYGREGVGLTVDASDAALDSDSARAVGLIVTELVANAFTHAFPDGTPGRIAVRFGSEGDAHVLEVTDTGIGLAPAAGEQPSSLGLRLVRLLTERLQGMMRIEGTAGTRVTITFPV
jgi:PAS domain S-box-containing protein